MCLFAKYLKLVIYLKTQNENWSGMYLCYKLLQKNYEILRVLLMYFT